MDFSNEKVIKVELINPCDKADTIATFYVNASVKTAFAQIRITPSPQLNFGDVLIEEPRKMSFFIENLSPFELKYFVTNGAPYKDILAIRKLKGKQSALKSGDMAPEMKKLAEYAMEIVKTFVPDEDVSIKKKKKRKKKKKSPRSLKSGRKKRFKRRYSGSSFSPRLLRPKKDHWGNLLSIGSLKSTAHAGGKMSWRSVTGKRREYRSKKFKPKDGSGGTKSSSSASSKSRTSPSGTSSVLRGGKIKKSSEKRASDQKSKKKGKRMDRKESSLEFMDRRVTIRGVLKKSRKQRGIASKKKVEDEEPEDDDITDSVFDDDETPESRIKFVMVDAEPDELSELKMNDEISDPSFKDVNKITDLEIDDGTPKPQNKNKSSESRIKFDLSNAELKEEMSELKIQPGISEQRISKRKSDSKNKFEYTDIEPEKANISERMISIRKSKKRMNMPEEECQDVEEIEEKEEKDEKESMIVSFFSAIRQDSGFVKKGRRPRHARGKRSPRPGNSKPSTAKDFESPSSTPSFNPSRTSPGLLDSLALPSRVYSGPIATSSNPLFHSTRKLYSVFQSAEEMIGHDVPINNIVCIGDFIVYPKFSVIKPCGTAEISVIFRSDVAKTEEQHIAFSIPGVENNERGIIQYLIATSCMPDIDITDPQSLFRDIIINENSEVNETVKGEQSITYNIEKGILNFNNVILRSMASVNVHIENKSHNKGFASAYLNKIPRKTFVLQPSGTILMPPYSTEIFKLIFYPASVGTFFCRLRLRGHLPNGENPTNDIYVEGECVVPLIRVVSPPPSSNDRFFIDFGNVSAGDTSTQTFTLKNVGPVDAKVYVETVCTMLDDEEDYKGRIKPRTKYDDKIFIVTTNENERIGYCTPITLLIGESIDLLVTFTPRRSKTYSAEIKLHVPNNPFEMDNLLLRGRSYRDSFAIRGLPLVKTKALLDEFEVELYFTDIERAKKYWAVYKLNFGVCQVNSNEKKEFFLVNQHKTIIRFEWPEDPLVHMVPRVGHINPNSSKRIKATFRAPAADSINKVPINCVCLPIEYVDKNAKKEEWDLENKQVIWPEDDTGIAVRKCEIKEIEPPYIGSNDKLFVISLMTSGVGCFPVVTIAPKFLQFDNLFSFQSGQEHIELKNRGIIDVMFEWKLNIISLTKTRPEIVPEVVVTSFESVQWDHFKCLREITFEEESIDGSEEDVPVMKDVCDAPFHIQVEPSSGCVSEAMSMDFTVSLTIQGLYSISANLVLKTEADIVQDEATVIVNGTSVLPCCYLIAEKLFNLPSSLLDEEKVNPNLRIIEVTDNTLKKLIQRKFIIFNTTKGDYTFHLKHVDSPKSNNLIYTELKPVTGSIRGGTYEEITIFILIEEYGFSLFQWSLIIDEWAIEQPFLIKVRADRPKISVLPKTLTMDPITIGSTAYSTIVITNNEMQHFNFYFDPLKSLKIHPQKGTLNPNSEEKIKIEFAGHDEDVSIITLNCHIENVPEPFAITVHTKCYPSPVTVFFEDSSLKRIEMDPKSTNVVNIGEIIFNVPSCKIKFQFLIKNSSEIVSYYYEWNFNDVDISKFFIVDWPNREGILNPDNTEIIPVTVQPLDVCKKIILNVSLKIRLGHEYKIQLKVASVESLILFEISEYDFHTCLVQKSNKVYNETSFKCFNKTEKSALIEKHFFDTDYLKLVPSAFILEPFSERIIRIYFLPREEIDYNEKIEFMINGITSNVISVHGRGETLKVKLDNIREVIDVGDVLVGQIRQIELPIVNAGSTTVQMKLSYAERSDVSLTPRSPFLAYAKSKFIVTVKYAPTTRKALLDMTVYAETAEETRPLFQLKARPIGFSVHLDRNALVFDHVIIGKSHTLKVALINDGEIGTKYTWDFDDVSDIISINPVAGYISAGGRIITEVKCTPLAVTKIFAIKVHCRLEDADDFPLFISYTCVPHPRITSWIVMETKSRQSVRKTVPIINTSAKERRFELEVEGEFFSGSGSIVVPAGATVDHEITYTPLFMTGNLEHKGFLYVIDPHAKTGETYGLMGLSSEPAPEGTIDWTVESREQSSRELLLKNWLDTHQRFRVYVSSPESGGYRPYQIDCFQYCDIPPNGEIIFTINFIAYKTNKYVFEVTFKNEENDEYMLYYLFIEVKPSTQIKEFSAETMVRKSVFINLPFSNPLSQLKERIRYASLIEELQALNSPLIIPPESNAEMIMEYKPLVEKKNVQKILIFKANYVDDYKYKLILTALPGDPEEAIKLKVNLGDFVEKVITISNLSSFDTSFTVKSDDKGILLTTSKVSVLSNATSNLRIRVEPMEIGSFSMNLTAISDKAGTYLYPLDVKCDPPSPRGPYKLKAGHSLLIPFKNIFNYTVMFAVSTSPFFEAEPSLVTIQPKAISKIRVAMVSTDALAEKSKNTIYTGNMTIKVVQDDFPPHKWIYYLSGIV